MGLSAAETGAALLAPGFSYVEKAREMVEQASGSIARPHSCF
jgi:hypothetical protein